MLLTVLFSITKCSLLAFYSRFVISRRMIGLLSIIVGLLISFTLGFILVSALEKGDLRK